MKHTNKPVFIVRYGNIEYTFAEGAKSFIFHAGIGNDTIKEKDLIEFTEKVYLCYIADSNNTNLGMLTDYIAQHWQTLRKTNRYALLEKYYSEADL